MIEESKWKMRKETVNGRWERKKVDLRCEINIKREIKKVNGRRERNKQM